MAKIDQIKVHEEKGKVLEKKGKVKDWTVYNKEMRKLSIEAAAEQKSRKKEREYNEDVDAGYEIAERWAFGSGVKKSFSMGIGEKRYKEIFGT